MRIDRGFSVPESPRVWEFGWPGVQAGRSKSGLLGAREVFGQAALRGLEEAVPG